MTVPIPPPDSPVSRKRAAAAVIAAAVLIAAPVTALQEGYVSKARPDPAHISTYCYGETEHVDPTRIYSRGECETLLRARLRRDYAPKILACLPQFSDERRVPAFAAFIDASYNAGPAAMCASPMAAAVRAGRWAAACEAFVGWRITARDRKTGVRFTLPGLVRRRRDVERPLCLKAVI